MIHLRKTIGKIVGSKLVCCHQFFFYKTDQKLGPESPNALTVDTFKVMSLLSFLASLDDKPGRAAQGGTVV